METKNAKQFKTVQEWIKSNPDKEVIEKVLQLVNRSGLKEMRVALYKKQAELKKNLRFVDQMKELGYKASEDVKARLEALVAEVKELETQVGPTTKRVKKEKVKVTETPETPKVE